MFQFTEDSPFVQEDNRRFRNISRVTAGSLNARHQAMLPPEMIRGKSVLDLGCCIGATGEWCLQNGAASYTGIESQKLYADTADELLKGYGTFAHVIHTDILTFFDEWNAGPYDIVVLAGVIYGFVDPFHVLRQASQIARETIIIDTLYPTQYQGPQDAYRIDLIDHQRMNVAGDNTGSVVGNGSRIAPGALNMIMSHYGFDKSYGIQVPAITDTRDPYNERLLNDARIPMPLRFIRRYDKTNGICTMGIGEQVGTGQVLTVSEHYELNNDSIQLR